MFDVRLKKNTDVMLSQFFLRSGLKILTCLFYQSTCEPRREKNGFRGFRPGLTQTELYKHRSRLEA